MVDNYQGNCILECSSATDNRSDFFTFFLQRMSAGWGRPIWRWRADLEPLQHFFQMAVTSRLLGVERADECRMLEIEQSFATT